MNLTFATFLLQTNNIDNETYKQIMEFSHTTEMQEYLSHKKIINIDQCNKLLQLYSNTNHTSLESIDKEIVRRLPKNIADKYTCMLIHLDKDYATVAMANPLDEEAIDTISIHLQIPLKVLIASRNDLLLLIRNHYEQPEKITRLSNIRMQSETESVDAEFLSSLDQNHSLDQLILSILNEAANQSATDIHIEKHNALLKVFFRVNQRMLDPIQLNSALSQPLKQKLLLLADGKITDSQKSQDLSFKFDYNGQDIFTRMSVLPTVSGYSIVIRLFHQHHKDFFTLQNTIHDTYTLNLIQSRLHSRKGMIILSGPVNTGKTTTLYSIMQESAKENRVIISAEDPVEVRFNNINQVMVKSETEGLSFDAIVRSSMRQNPDLIAVGEIRDGKTANTAMRACIMGSMVLSTLHATSAINTISRLIDIGAEYYLLTSSLKLILSQRLLRVLCSRCRTPDSLDKQSIKVLKQHGEDANDTYFSPAGCSFCHSTGYIGYQPIIESLSITDELAQLCRSHTFDKFKDIANKQLKGKKLLNNAFQYCQSGLISTHDIKRLALEYA
ncbi:MAG TPA: ATPase, T2SS/T4P/T4SS family [Gammaproteobacteria bacterium]|nr:ATPase, T2SS/T4P/T4SS family [Gammaproteobacteria bacterium]